MMRAFLGLMIFVPIITCAQDKNQTFIDEDSGKKMLTGYCTREAFEDSAFSWWWNSEWEMYEVNDETLAPLKEKMDAITITIVMGTWCSDSRREVPRFYKIIEKLNFPEEKIKLIAVDRDKKTESIDIEELDINFVPTFILYRDGEEIGRIIEAPQESLEIDMANMF